MNPVWGPHTGIIYPEGGGMLFVLCVGPGASPLRPPRMSAATLLASPSAVAATPSEVLAALCIVLSAM